MSDDDLIRRGDALAIVEIGPVWVREAIAALPAVTQPAPHVNETPKTEHDAGNVLTTAPDAAAIREAAQTIIDRVLQGASHEAAHLRELMVNATMSIRHPSLTRYRRWMMVNEAIRTLAAALITEKPHD